MFNELSPERQQLYRDYLTNATTEEEHLRASARMNKNDPDLYRLMSFRFKSKVDSFNLSQEAKEGLLYVSPYLNCQ
jgi:hypothetical protein